jgi:hypothetical protein
VNGQRLYALAVLQVFAEQVSAADADQRIVEVDTGSRSKVQPRDR